MVQVKPITVEHFELAASWLSRPEINCWLTSEWRDRKVSSSTIAMVVRNKRNKLYLVCDEQTPCGLVGLADIDTIDCVAMIWYLLGDPRFGGKGLITRAVKDVSLIGFQNLGLRNIYAWTMENNRTSIKVLERSGFEQVGRLRSATNSNGKTVDRIYYELVRKIAPA